MMLNLPIDVADETQMKRAVTLTTFRYAQLLLKELSECGFSKRGAKIIDKLPFTAFPSYHPLRVEKEPESTLHENTGDNQEQQNLHEEKISEKTPEEVAKEKQQEQKEKIPKKTWKTKKASGKANFTHEDVLYATLQKVCQLRHLKEWKLWIESMKEEKKVPRVWTDFVEHYFPHDILVTTKTIDGSVSNIRRNRTFHVMRNSERFGSKIKEMEQFGTTQLMQTFAGLKEVNYIKGGTVITDAMKEMKQKYGNKRNPSIIQDAGEKYNVKNQGVLIFKLEDEPRKKRKKSKKKKKKKKIISSDEESESSSSES